MPLSPIENPERVLIIQPRVGPQGLPWVSRQRRTTLKGLKRQLLKSCCNPFRVGLLLTSTQGRRFRANPGLSDCHPFRMAYIASTVHYILKCSNCVIPAKFQRRFLRRCSGRAPTAATSFCQKETALLVADRHFEPFHDLEQILPDLALVEEIAGIAQKESAMACGHERAASV